MKAAILNILRNRQAPVSGETLSDALGISRVSIWKHIQKLKEHGYRIEAAATGYRLLKSPDAPFPWEFYGRSERIAYYPEIGSTMDAAKRLAREGCAPMTVVVAGKQTEGRGRLQRPWFSDPGGLYFTMVLRPAVPVIESFKIGFLASVTMARTVREKTGVDARVKWPNDILVGDAKLCGMLVEMEAETDRVIFLNIGMGMNVNNDPSGLEPSATSLKALVGGEVSRTSLLAAFLDTFEKRLEQVQLDRVVDEWKALTMTIGRAVRVVTANDEISGIAENIDDSGALMVRQAGGAIRRVIYGDCFVQEKLSQGIERDKLRDSGIEE